MDATEPRPTVERLAAALAIALFDAHPVYGSTAGWRGGIGGAAVTAGCSLNDPPPRDEWMDGSLGLLQKPLRQWLDSHPEFDLASARAELAAELKADFDRLLSAPTESEG